MLHEPNDTTICNNAVIPLEISPKEYYGVHNQFAWAPVENLFIDSACTIPYASGTSTTRVYMKSNVAGDFQYTCVAYDTTTNCGSTANVTVTVLPSTITITASPTSICNSGTTTITVTPTTGYGTATFQFAESNDGINFTDIPGANGFTYTSDILTENIYYQWTASVGNEVCIQQQVEILINNPQIATTTAGSACGSGSVLLEATAYDASMILWYDSLNAIYPIASGNQFTTPVLTATEDYYVEPIIETNTFNVGEVSDIPSALSSYGNYGMYFATTNAVIINSVDIYPSTAGTLNISLINNQGQVVRVKTFTITTNDISTTTKKTLTLDFHIPANVSGWMLKYDLSIYRGSRSYSYPYTANGFSITGNTIDGNNITGGSRMYFYNWQVTSLCVGSREQVMAIITPAPEVSITVANNNNNFVCQGSEVNLLATSTNSNYTYWWSTNQTGGSITVYPTTTTTYSVTANDTNTGCITTAETTINVYPLPIATATVNNNNVVCGQSIQLTAGQLYTLESLLENFNGATHSMTAVNTSTGGTVSAAAWTLRPDGYVYGGNTFHSPDNSQFIMSNSDAQGSGGTTHTELISQTFSSVGIDSIVLEFDHYYRHYTGSTIKVEIYDGTNCEYFTIMDINSRNINIIQPCCNNFNNSYLNNHNLSWHVL